jgi:hypothetical protein
VHKWHFQKSSKSMLLIVVGIGVKDAERALADVERAGARTTIARAIVRVLALQLVAEMRAPLN